MGVNRSGNNTLSKEGVAFEKVTRIVPAQRGVGASGEVSEQMKVADAALSCCKRSSEKTRILAAW